MHRHAGQLQPHQVAIFSTGPILSCAGNRRRSSSAGTSARAARMKTAELYSDRSATIATLMPNFFGSIGIEIALCVEHLAQRLAQRRDHRLERLPQVIVPIGWELRRPLRRRRERRQLARRRHADLKQALRMQLARLGVVREQRLVAIDRLQHQEVGELGGGAPAGRRDAPAERFAALMEQPEQLGGERRQPVRRPRVQHGRNETVVEHHLLVGAALDHVRQRHAGVGLR